MMCEVIKRKKNEMGRQDHSEVISIAASFPAKRLNVKELIISCDYVDLINTTLQERESDNKADIERHETNKLSILNAPVIIIVL